MAQQINVALNATIFLLFQNVLFLFVKGKIMFREGIFGIKLTRSFCLYEKNRET